MIVVMIVQTKRSVMNMIQMGSKVRIKTTGEIGTVGALLGGTYLINIDKKSSRVLAKDLEEV